MVFQFVADDECDVGRVLLRRDEEYFRVSRSLWTVIDEFQGGERRAAIELAKYPVGPETTEHPLVGAARALMASPRRSVRAASSPWGRLEMDVTALVEWLAGRIGRRFLDPLALCLAAVAGSAALISGVSLKDPGFGNGLLVCPLLLVMLIMHELGHAVSAVSYGCRSHRIGMGFWFVFPVMYADVSEIWRLAPGKRIAVNLSGVAAQVWFGGALGLISLVAPYQTQSALRSVAAINLASVMANLMPFGRLDGYWVLCDWTGISDLGSRASGRMRSWFLGRGVRREGSGRMDLFVSIYSLGALIFAAAVCVSILRTVTATVSRAVAAADPAVLLDDCATHPLGWLLTVYVIFRLSRPFFRKPLGRGAAHAGV